MISSDKRKTFDTLVIVGNGFDLAHGYDTLYKSFAEKIENPYLEHFKSCCENEQDITTWYLFEENIRILTGKLYERNFIDGCDYDSNRKELEHLRKVFQEIHNLLISYLEKEISKKPIETKDSIKQFVDKNAAVFNFNYTQTAESYTENIWYIHGSLKEQDILLGYDYRDEPCLAGYQDVCWSKSICRENLAFRRTIKSNSNTDTEKNNILLDSLELYQNYANSGRGIDDELEAEISMFDQVHEIMRKVKATPLPDILYKDIQTIVVIGHGIEADKVYLTRLLEECTNLKKVVIFRYKNESAESFNKKCAFFYPFCEKIDEIYY